MLKRLTYLILIGLTLSVGVLSFANTHAHAADGLDPKGQACQALGAASGSDDCGAKAGVDVDKTLKLGINVFSLIVGFSAIIMIIVGGLKYIISNGESSNINSAKNTILYAIIGLVVVALAQVVVKFVLKKTTG